MSQGLRPLPFRKVQKALTSFGFQPTRQRGSHITFQHNDGRALTVPNHAGKDIAAGTLRAIIRYLGISVDEFLRRT